MGITLGGYVVRAVCLAIMSISFVSCSSASSVQVTGLQLTAREFTGDLNRTSAMAAITGLARNISDSSLKNVTIVVTFYDAQHNNLGSASSSKEVLSAGETWTFVVQLTSPDAWKARSYDLNTSTQ